jgi:mono/diheme cytochrome c family protein
LKDIKAGTMPPGAPLPAADQTKFAAWISAGYPQASGPTYKGQIAKILKDNCVSCHTAGGTSPDLSTYDLAKAQGAASLKDINAGTMPPGAPLAAADKAAFASWVSADYPVGVDSGTNTDTTTTTTPAAAQPSTCATTSTGTAASMR